jgi:hypothetical protein
VDVINCVWWWITEHATVLSTVVSACAAIAVAFFTKALSKTTASQLKEMRSQLRLANREYISTHRPNIIMRSFGPASAEPDSERTKATCRYVNIGDTAATILEIGGKIITAAYPLRTSVAFETDVFDPPPKIASGQDGTFELGGDSLAIELVDLANRDHGSSAQFRAFCVGYILYEDDGKRIRKTGFCRWYDSATNRWVKDPESEYEYAD